MAAKVAQAGSAGFQPASSLPTHGIQARRSDVAGQDASECLPPGSLRGLRSAALFAGRN